MCTVDLQSLKITEIYQEHGGRPPTSCFKPGIPNAKTETCIPQLACSNHVTIITE